MLNYLKIYLDFVFILKYDIFAVTHEMNIQSQQMSVPRRCVPTQSKIKLLIDFDVFICGVRLSSEEYA